MGEGIPLYNTHDIGNVLQKYNKYNSSKGKNSMEVDAILFHLSGDQSNQERFFAVVIIDISASHFQIKY